jgi:hypothetical protein
MRRLPDAARKASAPRGRTPGLDDAHADLGCQRATFPALVDDDNAPCFRHRGEDRRCVEGAQHAQIDDLGRDAVGLQQVGGGERLEQPVAVAD